MNLPDMKHKERAVAICACALVVIVWSQAATALADERTRSGGAVQCEDELAVVIHDLTPFDSTTLVGKLLMYQNGEVTLDCGKSVGELSLQSHEILEIYSVRRYTTLGVILGAAIGGGLGILAAKSTSNNRDCENEWFGCLGDLNSQINTGIILVGGGVLVGGIGGGILGHSIISRRRVSIDALPSCVAGNEISLGVDVTLRLTL